MKQRHRTLPYQAVRIESLYHLFFEAYKFRVLLSHHFSSFWSIGLKNVAQGQYSSIAGGEQNKGRIRNIYMPPSMDFHANRQLFALII